MVIGALATMVSLCALSWVREIVGGILGLFGADRESNFVHVSIIVVAVLFVYLLDFSINTGMLQCMSGGLFLTMCSPGCHQSLHPGLCS